MPGFGTSTRSINYKNPNPGPGEAHPHVPRHAHGGTCACGAWVKARNAVPMRRCMACKKRSGMQS
eukprot:360762-Chlamydomonas_euryale.AAC.6